MITIFGKTVYKVLIEGRRLVSPVCSFEYELGKVYKKKIHEPGYYSWADKEKAKKEVLEYNYTGTLRLGIYECRVPWFSKWKEEGPGEIVSEKIKIKRRL